MYSSGPRKKWAQMAPNGARKIFLRLIQTLPTFWAERIWILRIFIFYFLWSQISGLGPAWAHPLGPSMGPPTWARLGPTHVGPAWARPLGPSVGPHPLGPLGWAGGPSGGHPWRRSVVVLEKKLLPYHCTWLLDLQLLRCVHHTSPASTDTSLSRNVLVSKSLLLDFSHVLKNTVSHV